VPVGFDIAAVMKLLAGKRVAVACTPAGWLPGHGLLTDFLLDRADVRGFLALEHGLRGELQDGARFESCCDPRSGLPVFSFYGNTHTFPETFLRGNVDVVVFHAQDVSHRAYTYQWVLADTLAVAAMAGTEVVVVDRPTPLGHLGCQGPLFPQFFPLGLPVLLGVTLGELALWLRARKQPDTRLTVVPVQNWQRHQAWPETGLPWIPPSPNIPSLDAAYCYACTGILQATNVSEGRGTCKPFEYIGAPFLAAASLAATLNRRRLPGVWFREVYFEPAFNKYKSEVCAGVHLMVHNPHAIQPLLTMLSILQDLARLHPDRFTVSAGLSAWLDGKEWSVERLVDLDIAAFQQVTAGEAHAFLQSIVPLLGYGE